MVSRKESKNKIDVFCDRGSPSEPFSHVFFEKHEKNGAKKLRRNHITYNKTKETGQHAQFSGRKRKESDTGHMEVMQDIFFRRLLWN